MNTVKHTPGPWKYNETGFKGSANFLVKNDSGQLYVAEVNSWSTDAETEANAKLIAAAPELLEALQNLITQVQQDCSIGSDPKYLALCERTQEAMQAIKKATE